MKINPEKIILESKDFHFKKKIFLISGNEETLIKKIHIFLYKKLGMRDLVKYKKM